jgi:hypothetical protein
MISNNVVSNDARAAGVEEFYPTISSKSRSSKTSKNQVAQ